MEDDKIYLEYSCQSLIDQGKYIDDDPVGYRCSGKAKWNYLGYFVCEKCKDMIQSEPERISLGTKNSGEIIYNPDNIKHVEDKINSMVKELLN